MLRQIFPADRLHKLQLLNVVMKTPQKKKVSEFKVQTFDNKNSSAFKF